MPWCHTEQEDRDGGKNGCIERLHAVKQIAEHLPGSRASG
jgi:hypothetical protein